jgi:hypothetical protein
MDRDTITDIIFVTAALAGVCALLVLMMWALP